MLYTGVKSGQESTLVLIKILKGLEVRVHTQHKQEFLEQQSP